MSQRKEAKKMKICSDVCEVNRIGDLSCSKCGIIFPINEGLINLTFVELLALSKLIEDQKERATPEFGDVYVKIRREIRRQNSL
jgi:hypothetical protein